MDIFNFKQCKGFDWDDANRTKNWAKHQVSMSECEETFFNEPIIVFEDNKHSTKEDRFWALGKTNRNRLLLIVYTLRKDLIRVISARDMSRKEREIYEQF